MMENLRWTGLLGLLGALLTGTGEFLLHFDPQARFGGAHGYAFMSDISEPRLTAGHFFAVAGVPFYFVGFWHLAGMLRPVGAKLAWATFLITSYGFMFGLVWMGSRASIGSLVHHAALADVEPLIALYQQRYESLLQVTRVTTLLLSVLYIYAVLTGRSRYPRWMALTNPILLTLASFGVFWAAPEVGKYLMPIAMNVAFGIFFTCSLWFGDTRLPAGHGEGSPAAAVTRA